MIPIRIHNVLDYAMAAAFLLLPSLGGLSGVYFAHDVFRVVGFGILGYSLLTDYPRSLIKAMPLGVHMTFDVVCGIFVIIAPWVYNYRDELTPFQSALHWVLGLLTVASVILTERHHEELPAAASGERERARRGEREQQRERRRAA
jgi:hypothetical protein